MQRERITPNDEAHWLELRRGDLTSTAVAALFDASPYTTRFQLWHEYRNGIEPEFIENERMSWGRHLEAAIAQTAADKEKIKIAPFKDYVRIKGLRIGSSFDFVVMREVESPIPVTFKDLASGEESPIATKCYQEDAIFEIKNVDSLQFKNGWSEDENGNIEAPLHIEIQIQHQMLVADLNRVELRALVGGNKLIKITRFANKEFQELILQKCAEFWHSVDNNIEPPPDFEKNAEFIAKLYSFANPGTVADVSSSDEILKLVLTYKQGGELEKQGKLMKDAAKAEILTMIGEYEKAVSPLFSISAGMIGPTTVSYERKGYRDFRIHMKKQKENP